MVNEFVQVFLFSLKFYGGNFVRLLFHTELEQKLVGKIHPTIFNNYLLLPKGLLCIFSYIISALRQILNLFVFRIATNKLLLAVIIFVELCILGGVVYLRFFKNKK